MTRLLVLWLLSERPLYGYEITRSLTDSGMRFWFSVEEASIYSVLRTLERNGYAVAHVEGADTGRPRRRYSLTRDGRVYYRKLLRQALRDPVVPPAPVEVALAATGDLDPIEVRALLGEREAALRRQLELVATHARAAPDAGIVRRREALLAAELTWLAAETSKSPTRGERNDRSS